MIVKILMYIDSIPLPVLLVASLTLGLAPFFPEPHLFEKLRMLMRGSLVKPMDMFDLLFHATPWILLLVRVARILTLKSAA